MRAVVFGGGDDTFILDKSVSVNLDSDCSGETGWFGFGFRRRVFGKVSNSVMVPESCNCLLILQVGTWEGYEGRGLPRRGGLIECEEIVGVKKKVEGGLIRQPTLRGDQIRQDQSIFIAQKWEPIVNTSKKGNEK